MSNKMYDFLKWFALIFMPALTTFVGIVMKCFDIDCTDIVITIMTAFTTFLGAILGISNVNYKKTEQK